jgi:UDP-N-acetylmuramyl tripeptide synthase
MLREAEVPSGAVGTAVVLTLTAGNGWARSTVGSIGRGWARAAVLAGWLASRVSRRLGLGEGSIIGGRVTLALDPAALSGLAAGRCVVLVSGTNGKTTTSYLLAAGLRIAGRRVAHNATGSNMADGAVAALTEAADAPYAVLEVDEWHLAEVAAAVDPAVVILLNLTRDQLDRGTEVRAVAAALGAVLIEHPRTLVVANADDPMVVWAAGMASRTLWVAAGAGWTGDTETCPRCGGILRTGQGTWSCACGLTRPDPDAWLVGDVLHTAGGVTALDMRLPGRFNIRNAALAVAAAAALGVPPLQAAMAMGRVDAVAGRFAIVDRGQHELRLLLAKNPAGWAETLSVLEDARALLVVINAREADGRDTSWLWDVPFERLPRRAIVASGERAADLGVRLSYAGLDHQTRTDPVAGLSLLPPGKVDVVANYTAFHQLMRRLTRAAGTP